MRAVHPQAALPVEHRLCTSLRLVQRSWSPKYVDGFRFGPRPRAASSGPARYHGAEVFEDAGSSTGVFSVLISGEL
jgi:hypothetical protein